MRRTITWTAGLSVAVAALAACGDTGPGPAAGSGPHSYYATIVAVPASPRPATPTAGHPARTPASISPPPPVKPVPAAARDFAWADDDTMLGNAATFTVTRGITPEQALRIIAPRAETQVLTVAQAQRFADLRNDASGPFDGSGPYYQVVAATSRNGWTLVLEDNGFLANDDKVAARLGRRGPAAILFSNVNALMSYTYARGGKVVRSFDPLLGADQVGRPLPQERDLHFGSDATADHVLAVSMALTRRLLGFTARPADVAYGFEGYTSAVVVKY